jgi:hypothetical protein
MNWQSSSRAPAFLSTGTSHAIATFEAFGARLNMLSPQNAPSNPTP